MTEELCKPLFSQAPGQNDWQEFKPLFGEGKIKICDTLRASDRDLSADLVVQ
jgi:hypothetical protein